MKPYGTLTPTGKLRRLHALATAALAGYDLDAPEITFHAFETNLLYRVTTTRGERFMLRLAVPGWRSPEDLRSEAMWLQALARDTDVRAPRIMLARSGEAVLPLELPGASGTWHATLMSWVPGRLLGHYLTDHNLAKMGALFAALHAHAASWTPPAGFTTRRFEHWLSRGEANLITEGERPAPGAALHEQVSALPARAREVLERMHRHVEAAYAAIDRSGLSACMATE